MKINLRDDLSSIISRLDIQAFFQAKGVMFRKGNSRGGWYVDCPFCGEQGKLGLSQKGLWKCHKCEEKGNAITLLAKMQRCSNGDAVKAIKEFLGIDDSYSRGIALEPSKADQKGVPINLPPPDSERLDPSQEAGQVTREGPSEDTARGPARARDIYRRFVRETTLSDAHRQELRTKRGFADAEIDRLAFRSGGQHIIAVMEQLRGEFSDQELKQAGLLIKVNGTLSIDSQLADNRVIIPYLDEQGEVYHLRPHKLGLKDRPPEPYCRFFLAGRPEQVILTEGEFKAVALWQAGIPSLAVPGISSFGKKHFDRLAEALRQFGVKHVTVIFDNETKDNPAFPTYKEKPEDRYDTQFWSYMMAYSLSLGREGLITRVGWLPDEWRQDGKADWDGALAAGHTRNEFLAVIDRAVTPKEFLEALPEEGARVVKRKLARQFTHVPTKRDFNKYVAQRHRGGETYEETISNFVINIKSSFFTPDGVIRNVELINEYGEVSEPFPLDPGDMAGLNEFKKFCFGKGNYVFEGKGDDLTNIWKLEFLRDTGDLIYMPDRIGLIKNGIWLFGNMAIKAGKVYRPDNDGIVWIGGKGYKPQSLQIGARGEAIEDAIPALSERSVDIVEIARRINSAVGGYEAYVGLGWVVATIFSRDIFERYKCLPILFLHGKRESGKSTFMRWLMTFFGVETEGIGIAETTQNFITRALSYYSGLGCWFDEYRNEPKVTQKDGYFRSAYNRQLSGKGTATAFQARGFSVHAAVALSGEELPRDNGLFTRLVPVQMSVYRRDRTWYEWLNRQAVSFSGFTFWLLTHYEEIKPKILTSIAELKEALVAKGVSDRTAENWAICAGAFDAAILQDDEFIKWVEKTCQEIKRSGEDEHMLNQFWDDVNYLVAAGEVGSKYLKNDGQLLYVWIPGLYEVWAIHYRKKTGREPFDRASIRKYLQEEPYFKDTESQRLGDTVRKAYTLDVSQAPVAVQEIAATILQVDLTAGRSWKRGEEN